jgi:predicted RNase H-like HicB family nuclease
VCPSPPDCYSQGKTVSEALANTREAIEVSLEDMESRCESIPDPSEALVGSVIVMSSSLRCREPGVSPKITNGEADT